MISPTQVPAWFKKEEHTTFFGKQSAARLAFETSQARELAAFEFKRAVEFTALVEALVEKEKAAVIDRWREHDTSSEEAILSNETVIQSTVQ